MELHDYLTAIRRYWRTWVGLTLIGILAALVTIQLTPKVYRATAGVFVASTLEGTSASQFVNQRVRSYPEIAHSLAVLGPVIDELDLDTSFRQLRTAVTATNPVDTSHIDISVTSESPKWAADIANAVADKFGQVVESLEAPTEGESPVNLTVTDPATAPLSPTSPDPVLLLALGLVVGLFLGMAAAVVRSRMNPALYTEDDVRTAWGDGRSQLIVHAHRPGRSSRHGADTPVTALIRQLEALAERQPVRLLAVSPIPGQEAALTTLLAGVAGELSARGVPTTLLGEPGADPGETEPQARIRLQVATPAVALRDWRRMTSGHDGLVAVSVAGRVTTGQLRAVQAMAAAVDLQPVAVVLVRNWHPSVRTASATGSAGDTTAPAHLRVQPPSGITGVDDSGSTRRRPAGVPLPTGCRRES